MIRLYGVKTSVSEQVEKGELGEFVDSTFKVPMSLVGKEETVG